MKLSVCIPVLLLFTSVVAVSAQAQIQEQGQAQVQEKAPKAEALAPPVHARVSAAPINEMSGIVKSRRRDNLYWVHNDSGDKARLFAIDGDGHNILPTYSRFSYYGEESEEDKEGKQLWQGFEVLDAGNIDWEDIAADEHYLYVADVGNNGNARRDLSIYMVSEIDPTASTRTAVIRKLPVAYPEQHEFPPDQRHYDSESLFVDAGKLYLITKHREGFFDSMAAGANLYRLDTDYTDQDNQLTLVDSHPALTAATGAELSPDGQTLAVISYTDLWLFARPPSGDQWLSAAASRYPLNTGVFEQVEGITWDDDDTLLISNEQRDIFRVVVSALPGR